jgi:hypothetical protein
VLCCDSKTFVLPPGLNMVSRVGRVGRVDRVGRVRRGQ